MLTRNQARALVGIAIPIAVAIVVVVVYAVFQWNRCYEASPIRGIADISQHAISMVPLEGLNIFGKLECEVTYTHRVSKNLLIGVSPKGYYNIYSRRDATPEEKLRTHEYLASIVGDEDRGRIPFSYIAPATK